MSDEWDTRLPKYKHSEKSWNIIPKPLTKQDPIRWDFSQDEIEKMMMYLNLALCYLNPESDIYKKLSSIKDDWQRKIDWNIQRGLWK